MAVAALAWEKREESQRQLEVRIDVSFFYLQHAISTLAQSSKTSWSIVLTRIGAAHGDGNGCPQAGERCRRVGPDGMADPVRNGEMFHNIF